MKNDVIAVLYLFQFGEWFGGVNASLEAFMSQKNNNLHIYNIFFESGDAIARFKPYAKNQEIIKPTDDFISAKRTSTSVLSSARILFSNIHLLKKIINYIERNKIDVVHSNNLKTVLIACAIKPFVNVKIVSHIRSASPLGIRGKFIEVMSDKIISVSSAAQKKSFGRIILPHKHCILHNGRNPESFAKLKKIYDLSNRKYNVIFVGALVKWKRPHLFLQIAQSLSRKRSDICFHVFGDYGFGEEDYKEELEKMKDALSPEVVKMHGYVKNIYDYMLSSDVLVVTSDSEPLGGTLIEAMFCGLPVIAHNSGGNCEIITNMKTGILVGVAEPEYFVDAIEKIIDDSEFHDKLRKQSLKISPKRFDIKIKAEQLFNVYKSVIQ
ncbi:glycosyltransferase family 4 protein [Candidatus Thiodiazotropha sp. CDECU1]|uniref:glycosyltransferase family 4 protein n=1 Tax=Candidatus Thiodiazotropha sp. CDECU1 TaxID=3065865 RepID=UPI00292E275C|nr:glycosyltransferase family 4 protein [Candidatus Thiodiazotropha sp. CDECU1]